MYRQLKKQQGMTLTGWLVVIAIGLFFALSGLKIIPVYLENFTVKDVVESLKNEPLITKKSTSQVE